jgi:hypothetical protein
VSTVLGLQHLQSGAAALISGVRPSGGWWPGRRRSTSPTVLVGVIKTRIYTRVELKTATVTRREFCATCSPCHAINRVYKMNDIIVIKISFQKFLNGAIYIFQTEMGDGLQFPDPLLSADQQNLIRSYLRIGGCLLRSDPRIFTI